MKILIDIGHPAHVHYFRNFIAIMESRGHKFIIIARTKPIIIYLLNYYRIDFVSRGEGKNSIIGKVFHLVSASLLILFHSLRFKPDLYLSQGGIYTSSIAWLCISTILC